MGYELYKRLGFERVGTFYIQVPVEKEKLTLEAMMYHPNPAKDTEQDLVLVPHAFWHRFLQPKLEKLLDKKLPANKSFKADETNVVVSVTDRSERDLVKQFDELDIECRSWRGSSRLGVSCAAPARGSESGCHSITSRPADYGTQQPGRAPNEDFRLPLSKFSPTELCSSMPKKLRVSRPSGVMCII